MHSGGNSTINEALNNEKYFIWYSNMGEPELDDPYEPDMDLMSDEVYASRIGNIMSGPYNTADEAYRAMVKISNRYSFLMETL